jgi:hypothetical protein
VVEQRKIRDIIASASLVPNLKKVVHILVPINALVVNFQSGKLSISEV